MALTWIILLLLAGLACLFAEFFLFPGLTAAGVIGSICLITGVYLGYSEFGYQKGNILFLSSAFSAGFIFWFGLKNLSSNKYAVHEQIEAKVNVIDANEVAVGEQIEAISALRPGGTAMIRGKRFEVFTRGEFVPSGTTLEVIKVTGNKIMVKAIDSRDEVPETQPGPE